MKHFATYWHVRDIATCTPRLSTLSEREAITYVRLLRMSGEFVQLVRVPTFVPCGSVPGR